MNIQTHISIHTLAYIHTYMHEHTHTSMNIQTHISIHMHAHTLAHIHKHTWTHTPAWTYKHASVCTHTHTMHTHIHVCSQGIYLIPALGLVGHAWNTSSQNTEVGGAQVPCQTERQKKTLTKKEKKKTGFTFSGQGIWLGGLACEIPGLSHSPRGTYQASIEL